MRFIVLVAIFGTMLAHGEDCGPVYVSAPRYPLLAFQARVSGRVQIEMESAREWFDWWTRPLRR